jgi:lipoprotein-releasing system ATP-binding protein
MVVNEKPIVLCAKSLHKAFYSPIKVSILDGIDLTVLKGESVAIMGRSGEGKTTLLQILGTLENPCSGLLEISGQLVASKNKNEIRNQNIAFVFQSFHLLEDYTALENILMPARIARKSTSKGSVAYKRGCDLLEQVGLADRAHFYTKLMSGGEKQRVAICRALFNDPDIIFADEPSGNLDKQTSLVIHDLLLNFSRIQNKSLVVVTHDQELAARCDHRYQLALGRLSSSL